jgi:protein SCO1/2
MQRRRRLVLPVTTSLLAVAALIFAILATRDSKSSKTATQVAPGAQLPLTRGGFAGAELPQAKAAPPIALFDQYGRPVSLASLRGEPVVIAFLYTRCGAPCTLIAQQIRGALDELSRPVPVLLVSADPSGDTPVAVRHFLAQVSLSGRVYYLTGPEAALRRVWRAYRISPAARGAAAFERSATVLLIDQAGRERVIYGPEQLTPEALAHDIGKLQNG